MKRITLWFVLLAAISLVGDLQKPPALVAAPISNSKIRAIIIAEDDSWLLPLLTPVVARIEEKLGKRPLLFVLPKSDSVAKEQLLHTLSPKNVLRIHSKGIEPPKHETFESSRLMTLPQSPLSASIKLAKRFWKNRQNLYACSLADGEAYLQASTLAALKVRPLIAIEDGLPLAEAHTELSRFGKIKVTLISDSKKLTASLPSSWQSSTTAKSRVEIVDTLGHDKIRNVAVVSSSNHVALEGQLALLGPYYALCRKSALVIMSTYNGSMAQSLVENFIRAAQLKPRTVTLLASYDDISLIELTDRSLLGEFDVSVEPCASNGAAAIPYGIGRLFHVDLAETSILFARILSRHRLVKKTKPSVVLMNNPATEYGAIPLAETVGRLTAKELKNAGVKVKEYNGVSSIHPPALKAASKASVFLFQGHIVDLQFLGSDFSVEGEGVETSEVAIKPIEFQRGPLVILQSCTSLDGTYVPTAFNQGALSVIGSSTSIHSSSGSSFTKTICHGLAYDQLTVGEALNKAKNYFLCLYHLKMARGHKEQAKVFRVSMSFRLIGDPEMKILLDTNEPKKQMVDCSFSKDGSLRISVPEKKYPKVETAAYFIKAFPGSQTAGLVKKLKNKEIRRITSTYFFTLDAPKDFIAPSSLTLSDGSNSDRAVHLYDPLHRKVHVLYYPKKEERGSQIDLRFHKGELAKSTTSKPPSK